MISSKDWKAFTDMYDLESRLRTLRDVKRNRELRAEWNKEREKERERCAREGRLIRFSMPPMIWSVSARSRTVEGCLDWIKEGRPTFAKKLTIES